jgi:hypothetical protein
VLLLRRLLLQTQHPLLLMMMMLQKQIQLPKEPMQLPLQVLLTIVGPSVAGQTWSTP